MVTLVLLGCRANEVSGPTLSIEEMTDGEELIAQASTEFGFRLAKAIVVDDEHHANVLLSPFSVAMNLALAANGADGKTLSELWSVLGYEGTAQPSANVSFGRLVTLLTTTDPSVELDVANSVWFDRGLQIDPAFAGTAEESFQATVRDVGFSSDGALDQINGWVSEATNGHVTRILESLPSGTSMSILNATYFDAAWTVPFDRDLTTAGPFQTVDGTTTTVQFMSREGRFRYGIAPGAEIVEVPYGSGVFAMTIVLPQSRDGLGALMNRMSRDEWGEWIGRIRPTDMTLHLPKFDLEWNGDLSGELQDLGIRDAFSSRVANFSRAFVNRKVWMGAVRHATRITIDEEGTTASAVTSAILLDSGTRELRVNRPFLFAIRELHSGTVMFLGIVYQPRGEI